MEEVVCNSRLEEAFDFDPNADLSLPCAGILHVWCPSQMS